MRNIYDLTIKELEDYFISINEKKFRAVQVYEALYKRRKKLIFYMKSKRKK
jgi:23S rRNA (adenine2503-C2)-methyltransferase